MDQRSADRRVGDQGVSSVQFVLASALALILFVALVNLVVFQYGRGALRSALEQGVRAGSVGGVAACEETANAVVADLLGGTMSDGLVVTCTASGSGVEALGTATFQSWTPLMPDLELDLVANAIAEP